MAKPTVLLLLILGLLASLTAIANGAQFGLAKPGSCPPARPTAVCMLQCQLDLQCSGLYKCCPTSCGTSCTLPVTEQRAKIEKPGQCPVVPEGPWVCTSRCSHDSDCRRDMKCCRNRCGALACQRPAI